MNQSIIDLSEGIECIIRDLCKLHFVSAALHLYRRDELPNMRQYGRVYDPDTLDELQSDLHTLQGQYLADLSVSYKRYADEVSSLYRGRTRTAETPQGARQE